MREEKEKFRCERYEGLKTGGEKREKEKRGRKKKSRRRMGESHGTKDWREEFA